MVIGLVLWVVGIVSKKKKGVDEVTQSTKPNKVRYATAKKFNQYVGGKTAAVVAFVGSDEASTLVVSSVEALSSTFSRSKVSIVVVKDSVVHQIVEEQGITELPSIWFYKAGEAGPSVKFDGSVSADAVSAWLATLTDFQVDGPQQEPGVQADQGVPSPSVAGDL